MPIDQDLKVSRLNTDKPAAYEYKLSSTAHGVYAFVFEGSLDWGGVDLGKRDSSGIWATDKIHCHTGEEKTDVLFVETRM